MTLPQPILDLMWEYDPKALMDLSAVPDAVLERAMIRGGWEVMAWLKKSVGLERIREFLETRGRRVLPPRELRYWSFLCSIDESVADAWVLEAGRRTKAWRG